jgi:acyl-CoA synthetase (NDP forming)
VFADRAVKDGLALPSFSQRSVDALKAIIPSFGAADNPADTTAGVFNDPGLFTKALDIILEDPAIDQLSILLASVGGKAAMLAAQAIVAASAKTDKPVHVAWSGRRDKSEEAWQMFHDAGVPHMASPIRLAHAAAVLARYAEDRRRLLPRVVPSVALPKGLELPSGAVTLSEIESKAILSRFGVSTTREVVAPPNGDFTKLTGKLSGPFAVKIVSRDIAHKTEAGGVRLKVAAEDLPRVASEIIASAKNYKPDAVIDGVLVSEMASGVEALIGVVNDESFGPTVALGLGGVLTEVLKDVTFRIAPFDIETARDMIAELRGAKLFDGYRGSPPADKEALAAMLVEVSRMAAALGERVKEMDINPVFVRPAGEGCVAADALIVLK